MAKTKTEIEAAIARVNEIAASLNNEHHGGLERPIAFREEQGDYAGFFLNTDDERLDLYNKLRAAGYTDIFYYAPYHWRVVNPAEGIDVHYVEGDLYANEIQDHAAPIL